MHRRSTYIPLLTSLLVILLLFGSSCSPTRRLAEGDYLLQKTRIELDSKELDQNDLDPYRKQSPNKTILGIKFHLFLYSLANPEKEKGISGWLKKIGEEPVIWNPVLTERTTEQFERYLDAKGYYGNTVTDSVKIHRGKVKVTHYIELNAPHKIRSLEYKFEDQGLKEFIFRDTANCMIRVGNRFDKEVLTAERERIERILKNQGFYRFSKEYIFYEAIEIPERKEVDLKIIFKENVLGRPDPVTKVKHHYQYRINTATVYPDFGSITDASTDQIQVYESDSTSKSRVIYIDKMRIRPEAILLPNRCIPDSLYRLDDVRGSYNNYSAMGLFRVINIRFEDPEEHLYTDTSDYKYLNCHIELTPRKLQSYQYEIVGTHSAGDFGGRLNISYNNYNLLRGAENLQLGLTGALEDVSHRISTEDAQIQLMKEVGVESNLSIPKFLVPFNAKRFTRKHSPRTVINVSYNFQDRPDYVRTIANTSLSYHWKRHPYITHQLYPFEFNFVELTSISADLLQSISQTPLITSFSDHTILAARYSFEFTNQILEKKTDFVYLRASVESAGNMINMVSKLASIRNDSMFLNVPYFRYLKGDIDFRIHNQLTPGNKWAIRFFAGMGYPLGSLDVLPFEKMYFAGGPSGVRAWKTGELGPGADNDTTVSYASKLGDIKLEANFEYRFHLLWKLEGAWFIDAGNVWRLYEDRPGTQFGWDTFYKEIAVGTGVGGRFDFSFLIIRLDFGYKLRDPALPDGQRWIDFNRDQTYPFRKRFNFLFGIGYPF